MKVWKKTRSLLTGKTVLVQKIIFTQYEKDLDEYYDWVMSDTGQSKEYKLTNFYSPRNFPYDKFDQKFQIGVTKPGHHFMVRYWNKHEQEER